MSLLYHLILRDEWDGAADPYVPTGFDDLGFVHLSTSEQVDIPGRALFAGRDDVLLLVLDPARLDDVRFGFADDDEPDAEARLMTVTIDGISITNVYVPNGRSLDADHYQYKLRWLDRLARHMDVVAPDGAPAIIAGDFNIAPTDDDVYDPAVFEGATHVSPPERDRLRALTDRGLADVFRLQYPDAARTFSWWDYRRGDFHEGRGMRIDLVLASAPVVERTEWVVIDRNARKGQQPSDHAPVIVDLTD